MLVKPQPKFPVIKPVPKTIDQLYPQFTPDELAEAEYTLKRYLNLVWRIYQRLRRNSVEKSGKPQKHKKASNSQKIDENPFKR